MLVNTHFEVRYPDCHDFFSMRLAAGTSGYCCTDCWNGQANRDGLDRQLMWRLAELPHQRFVALLISSRYLADERSWGGGDQVCNNSVI